MHFIVSDRVESVSDNVNSYYEGKTFPFFSFNTHLSTVGIMDLMRTIIAKTL